MDQNKKDSDKKSEHSHSSGDSPDEEKPLKKARYIWEVKGKQHLKGDSAEETDSPESCSDGSETALDQTQADRTIRDISTKEKLIIHPESNAGPSQCCFGDIIERSSDAIDRVMQTAINEHYRSEDNRSPNKNEDGETQFRNSLDGSTSNEECYEDYLILKWQARQIARGYVDNTINTMLETEMYERPSVRPVRPRRIAMFEAPHRMVFRGDPDRTPPSHVDFVAVDPEFNVEHEAIFEAIKTHGLQSKENSSNAEASGSSQEAKGDKSGDPGETRVCEQEKSSINPNTVTTSQIPPFDRPTLFSTEADDTGCLEASPAIVEPEEVCHTFDCDVTTDPMDFLNAAVSVAIQKKGLTCG